MCFLVAVSVCSSVVQGGAEVT